MLIPLRQHNMIRTLSYGKGVGSVVFIYFARRLAERKAWSAGKAAMADEIRRNRAAASGLVFIHPEKCAVIR